MITPLPKNPMAGLSSFIAPRRQALLGLASGLLQGNDLGQGLGMGFERAAQGRQADDAYATAQKEEARRQEQLNQTVAWAQTKFPQLAGAPPELVADIAPKLYMETMKGSQPSLMEINGQLVNTATGEVVGDYRSQEGPKPTSSMQEYEFARSQGYEGTFQQYETDMKKAGATSIDFNANQGTAAAYADRMAAADAVLSDPKLESAQTDVVQQGLSSVPVAGNFITSEEKKLAEQAERDFINAILRRESGAVISPSEFENARQQYFPQPGDTPAVIKQKADNRKNAINGVARAAGPAYQQPGVMTPGGVVDYTTYFGGQ